MNMDYGHISNVISYIYIYIISMSCVYCAWMLQHTGNCTFNIIHDVAASADVYIP